MSSSCSWRAVRCAIVLYVPLAVPAFSEEAPSPAEPEPIVVGERRAIESDVLGEVRTVRVSLPADYEESDQRYGVVYLLDGNTLFEQAAGSVLHMRRFMPLIVVGIDNPDKTRSRDLTPATETTRAAFPDSEGSADFRRFLVDELRPFVDSHYRTNSIRLLVGHSFGGLFALETMLNQPGAFGAYLVLSPSLYFGDYLDRVAAVTGEHGMFESFVYFAIGDELMNPQFDEAVSMIESRAPTGFRWEVDRFPGLVHWPVALPSLVAGLQAYLAPIMEVHEGVTTLEELVSRFGGVSELYGEPIPPTASVVLQAVEELYVNGQLELAGQMFWDGIQSMPRETAFYEVGEFYEGLGQWDAAITLYEHGIGVFEGDPELDAFADYLKDRVAAVRAKAALSQEGQGRIPQD